jgi:hypothetical protein
MVLRLFGVDASFLTFMAAAQQAAWLPRDPCHDFRLARVSPVTDIQEPHLARHG